jgi:hypothetical protein
VRVFALPRLYELLAHDLSPRANGSREPKWLHREAGPPHGFRSRRLNLVIPLAPATALGGRLAPPRRDHAFSLEAIESSIDGGETPWSASAFLDPLHDGDAVCVARLFQQRCKKLKLQRANGLLYQ